MAAGFRRLVAQVTGWHVAASMCYYAIYAGTPLFKDAFDLSGFTVGLVIAALTLGYATFQLPVGMATDRFGEHRTLTVGLVGLSVMLVLVVQAPTYPVFLGLLFVMGSMYGTAAPGTNKAIFDNVAPGRQHSAIGIKQVGPTAGSALGAVLVTNLVGLVWYAGFVVAAGVGLVTATVFYLTYGGASRPASSAPDFSGLLANRSLVLLLLAGVCIGAGFYTTIGYTVLYVNESVGATVAVGGLVLATLQVTSSAGKVVAGRVADALPGDPRVAIGSILLAQALGGAAVFFLVPQTTTPLAAGVAFAALGVLALGSTGLYYSCISTVVTDAEIGAASAAGSFSTTLSGLFAPPLFGYLVDTLGYAAGWTFLGALALVAASLVSVVVFRAP
ncbi:MAG: MFS transporter [Haloarculaceae archaeon]